MENNNKNILVSLLVLLGMFVIAVVFLVIFLSGKNSIAFMMFSGLFLLIFFNYILLILFPLIKINRDIRNYVDGNTDFEVMRYKLERSPLLEFLLKLEVDLNKRHIADILNKQAEINYLQRQINPHFLYNCLESIRGNAIIMGADKIAEMTEALATFFRYSISLKGSIVTLEDEVENVNNYFTIQQYRFNNKFRIDYIYDKAIDLSEYFLPKLTIQPIVENAIFHGLETKVGKGNITIKITITEKRMIINIIDNGIGIAQERLDEINKKIKGRYNDSASEKGSIALSNVNKRIKLYFGDEYGLYLTSILNYGTDVEVVLPLVNSKDVNNYRVLEQ